MLGGRLGARRSSIIEAPRRPSYSWTTFLYWDNLSRLGRHYGRIRDSPIFGSPSVVPFVQGLSLWQNSDLLFAFDMHRFFNGQLMCHIASLLWLNFVISDYAKCHNLID